MKAKPKTLLATAGRVAIAVGLVLACSCENPSRGAPKKAALSQQVQQLTEQKAELQKRFEQSQAENERLQKQVETLSRLPGDKRAESLYHLQAVRVGRYTNLYDSNKDGAKEQLIVYVEPIDETGDVVKAAGAVEVQLWDLNKKGADALLAQWRVEPDELKKLWSASIVLSSYRLTFDVSNKIEKFDRPLTVKVTFTDYLSGRVFTEQKAIKP